MIMLKSDEPIPRPVEIGGVLTFIIRDDAPTIHCNDSPSYRTVRLLLTKEQRAQVLLYCTARDCGGDHYESVSKVILEPLP